MPGPLSGTVVRRLSALLLPRRPSASAPIGPRTFQTEWTGHSATAVLTSDVTLLLDDGPKESGKLAVQ